MPFVVQGHKTAAARAVYRREALHRAALRGRAAVVEVLLRQGANVHTADARGRQALHYAAMEGHAAAVEALLRGGADVAAAEKHE